MGYNNRILPFVKAVCVTLVVIAFAACGPQQVERMAPANDHLTELADSLFQGYVNDSRIAGISVIIDKGGETLLDKSYGFASLELAVPMPENAIFEIGSVTKQFTSVAILKLADEGRITLDDDFTKYVDFDTQGRKITVRQLLNHTSGIAGYTELPEFWEMSVHHYSRDSMISLVERNGFLFEPGELMSYNNSAYFLLGLIIENVTEMTYEEYLDQAIFTPLGMENTSYCSNSDIVPNKVYGYEESEQGLVQKEFIDHTWPYSAGSLCSTTKDLLTWLKALHSGKVLPAELYKVLVSPVELNDGTPLRYASGIIHYSDNGNEVIEHSGGINGFSSATRYYPEEDLFVICLKNSTGPNYIAENVVAPLIWEVIEKKETPEMELEADLIGFSDTYQGLVRAQPVTLELSVHAEGLVLQYDGASAPDTVTHYIGDRTWMNGNHLISLKEDEVIMDVLYAVYQLKSEN